MPTPTPKPKRLLARAGNEASRARLLHDVGYDTLATVIQARMGPSGAPLGVLQQVLTLALEVGISLPHLIMLTPER